MLLCPPGLPVTLDRAGGPHRTMRSLLAAFLAMGLATATPLAAQTDATGEWDAQYATPLGPQELKIYLTQEGPRITGHTTSEYGESQVRGSINGQDITFTFSS